MKFLAKMFCIGIAACAPACALSAPTLTTLYTFTGGADGGSPGAGLLQGRQGTLFGTTEAGGTSGFGTVFRMSPSRSAPTGYRLDTLYSFGGGSDGAQPTNMLADDGGNLYGVTSSGGDAAACSGNGCGTVFMLRPPRPG